MDGTLKMKIADTDVSVEWEENESVEALRNLAKGGPVTVQMSMYAASSRWATSAPICRETTLKP